MTMFVQQLTNGITQGGLYALLAISYALVYGILNLVNFSTGSLYMLGGFGAWIVMQVFTKNFVLSVLAGGLVALVFAYLLEKLAFKSIRGISRISSLICTIGFAQVINETTALIFGRQTRSIPAFFTTEAFTIADVSVMWLHVVIIIVVIVLLALLQVLVYYTRLGLCIRTVSMDNVTAGLMGMNVNRTISLAFSISGACAGIAGVLGAVYYSTISPSMGTLVGIKAFSAAVFGGLTSMPGAILGGYIMGIMENFGVQVLSAGYRDVISFVIMILFLLIRPQGLLGKKKVEKV